jgi:CRISPR-associated protein Csb2
MFSGKLADGTIRTDHGHAFYLPTDEDGDGRLDHLTVVAEAGFSRADLRALEALREIKAPEREESRHKLRVLLVGMGRLDEFRPKAVIGPSSRWISATPYLSHRHPNKKGSDRDTPEELASPAAFLTARLKEDIARLIARRTDLSYFDPAKIRVSSATDPNGVFRIGARNQRPLEFKRFRRKRSDDGGRRLSGAFVIDFGCPIDGPIALGHSCHFGMGLFLPAAPES